MASFSDIEKIFSWNLKGKYCIEIYFSIDGSEKFSGCWMGKMSHSISNEDIYWFGLSTDGLNAYDFCSFEEFAQAKVFDGKSLKEVCAGIALHEIDGLDPQYRLDFYKQQQ